MGKSRMEYKRKWRQAEKKRKWFNAFITEYTRVKFDNIYNEASCFYNALREMYPDKIDVKKTKEYRSWQKSLENQEPCIIVQHLYTDVSHGENEPKINSDTESENENGENSDTESENENGENSDTESENENGENENDENGEKPERYTDNMLLEIPLEDYFPTTNPEIPPPPPPPPPYDYEVFTDERIQEIVEELRDDPELRNIFGQPGNDDGEEDGVELPSLEEEVILDIEPFDYRLEVELADW